MCGVYFPGIGVLRSQYLPEGNTRDHYEFISYWVEFDCGCCASANRNDGQSNGFMLCAMLLGTAALCQQYLYQATSGTKQQQAEVVADLQGQELPATDAGSNDAEADVESGKAAGADGAVAQATGKDR